MDPVYIEGRGFLHEYIQTMKNDKGEIKHRRKRVYRQYLKRGRPWPNGSWIPTQIEIDAVQRLRTAKTKIVDILTQTGLKYWQYRKIVAT